MPEKVKEQKSSEKSMDGLQHKQSALLNFLGG
jgi:hypothetical protein